MSFPAISLNSSCYTLKTWFPDDQILGNPFTAAPTFGGTIKLLTPLEDRHVLTLKRRNYQLTGECLSPKYVSA